jgi:hypothetical protein
LISAPFTVCPVMGTVKGDEETAYSGQAPLQGADNGEWKGEGEGTPKFGILYHVFPRLVVVVYLIILFLWIYQAQGGLGFTSTTVFGLHALLMSAFVVVFIQEAILSFSSPLLGVALRSPGTQRVWHVLLHLGSLAFGICGMVAIVYYKSLSGPPYAFPFFTLYSPHSWLGVAVLSLWALQALLKLVNLALSSLDRTPSDGRVEKFRRVHEFTGKVIYVAGLATLAMGFQDMQSSDLAGGDDAYPYNGQLATYAAVSPILLLLIGMGVFSIFSFAKPRP